MPFPSVALRPVIVCLLAGAALTACTGEKNAAPVTPPPAQVTVVTLVQQPVTLTRELPGRTSPSVVAEVRPQVSGIVKARMFTEGSVVKAGQSLYQLEDSTYRADVVAARAQVARAEATAHSANLTARRTADLAAIDAVSRQENENTAAALRQAEADVAAAKAVLERAEVILGYTRIVSPIRGRIGKSTVTQGALVNANQVQALATVQQIDPVYVDIAISSSELLALRKEFAAGKSRRGGDLPVTILLEDGTPHQHAGKFAFTETAVDPGTGSVSLRVVVPNPQHVLLPGIYVRAVLGAAVRERAVLVPQKGIARDVKGDATAMVLGADGKVQARPVRVSQTIGDQWLVEDGLAAGDKVIVEGLQKIRPGMPAQGTEAAAPAPASAAAQR